MSKPRVWKLALITISLALVGVPAGQSAYAAPAASAIKGKVPSSGIGLAANLPEKGTGVLKNSTFYKRASKSRLWVQTPAGLVFRSCVYDVPSGSFADSIHDRITLPDGRVLPMKPCLYPRLTLPGAPTSTKAKTTPGRGLARGNGDWIDGFEADNLGNLGNLSVTIAAPYLPNHTNSSLFDYEWTALQSSDDSSLLQPAVGWGVLTVNTYRPPPTPATPKWPPTTTPRQEMQ
jgi:hypothetical protein